MIERELEVWSKLNHAHILPLIGIARIEGDANLPAFVSPWMEHGSYLCAFSWQFADQYN
jgi:hypothetical protein